MSSPSQQTLEKFVRTLAEYDKPLAMFFDERNMAESTRLRVYQARKKELIRLSALYQMPVEALEHPLKKMKLTISEVIGRGYKLRAEIVREDNFSIFDDESGESLVFVEDDTPPVAVPVPAPVPTPTFRNKPEEMHDDTPEEYDENSHI